MKADFVADPFLRSPGRPAANSRSLRSVSPRAKYRIGWATSPNGIDWTYKQMFSPPGVRLSYPHVFQHDGQWLMIPESWVAGEARLYRAVSFPARWELDTVLIRQPFIVDALPFQHEGRWRTFANGGPPENNQTLDLYFAPTLRGPWNAAPALPARHLPSPKPARQVGCCDLTKALPPRPGLRKGLWQPPCGPMRCLRLSETTTPSGGPTRRCLGSTGEGWNAEGMHHLDAVQIDDDSLMAVVDGRR